MKAAIVLHDPIKSESDSFMETVQMWNPVLEVEKQEVQR